MHGLICSLNVTWSANKIDIYIYNKDSFFWVLDITHRCDFRHNKLWNLRFSLIFETHTIILNFIYLKSAWTVTILVRASLNTTKPYSWQFSLFPDAHCFGINYLAFDQAKNCYFCNLKPS